MKSLKLFFRYTFVLLLLLLSSAGRGKNDSSDIQLVASTPCDDLIKKILLIPATTKVDFIRWNIILHAEQQNKTFKLHIRFGESQPNTLGFMNGGQEKTVEGSFTSSKEAGSMHGEVYHLKSAGLSSELLMVKMNEEIFHLLSPQKQLMVGNGGWSYTLNHQKKISASDKVAALNAPSDILKDTSRQLIFDGRTPCEELTKEYQLATIAGCFKLKWRLILNKDPKTLEPTTYSINLTNSRGDQITGKWKMIKGSHANPDLILYQLDPDKSGQSISLLAADKNVLFFLHKNNTLFKGNADFSYTLNRKL